MKIELRPWTEAYISQLVALANNANVAAFMTDAFPHPYGVEDAKRFIAFAGGHQPTRIFAVFCDERLAGGIGIHPQNDIWQKNAELGYWIGEPFWGKGIATEAIRQAVSIGFGLPGITRIFARPFGSNKASQRALEKNGFVLEASIRDGFYKNDNFQDELIYAVRKNSA